MTRGLYLALVLLFTAVSAANGCGSDETTSPATSSSSTVGAGGAGGGAGGAAPITPTVVLPKTSLDASELGVLVNDQDPQSVEVAAYYVQARGIDPAHVYTLSFTPPGNVLPANEFDTLYSQLEATVDPAVQAYVITWTTPYRVDCMSITAAFALGFDTKYCNTTGMGCGPTAPVDYYNSESVAPHDDFGVRPTMMLAGVTVDDVKAVIDRGVAADDTFPTGDGYMVRTTDDARSVRWPDFVNSLNVWDHAGSLTMSYVDNSSGAGSNTIDDTDDVLFYFTGLVTVPNIETNTYRPGAIADHLTSFGGQVPTSSQMSILRWLEAGATASYGTVVEPCNYPTKFPNTRWLLPAYYRGATVLEAYWKSVQWPGEGLFIGEPLARPWGTQSVTVGDSSITIVTTTLRPGRNYEVVAGPSADGPFDVALAPLNVPTHQLATIVVEPITQPFYVLRQIP